MTAHPAPFTFRLRTLGIGLVVGGLSWLAAVQLLPPNPESSDVALYERYANAVFEGAVPYRDISIEYPPGALLPILAPRLFGHGYTLAFSLAMAACGLALLLLTDDLLACLEISTRRRYVTLVMLAATPLLLGVVLLQRYDLFPAVLVAGALTAGIRSRWALAGFLLGLAVVTKIYPLVLLPALLVFAFRVSGRRAAIRMGVACTVALGVVMAPMVALAGGSAFHSLRLQIDRPLQIESTGAALMHAAHQLGGLSLGVVFSYGSVNLGGTGPHLVALVFTVAMVAALALVAWLAGHAPTNGASFVLCAATTLYLTLALGKVFSPQYLVWLVPAAVLVPGVRGVVVAGLTLTAAVMTNVLYPSHYKGLIALDSGVSQLVVARDGIVTVAAAVLLVSLWQEARVLVSTDVPDVELEGGSA